MRYADDLVFGFEHEADARRFLEAMRARLEAFALSLRPDKTRIIAFGRHAAANRAARGLGKPETFTFLGFTFICGQSRRGKFLILRQIPPRPRAGQAQGVEGQAATAQAPAAAGNRQVAGAGRARLSQRPCRPDQHSGDRGLPASRAAALAARAPAARRPRQDNLGPVQTGRRTLPAERSDPSSLA